MTTVSTIRGRPQAQFPLQVLASIRFILRSLRFSPFTWTAHYHTRDIDLPLSRRAPERLAGYATAPLRRFASRTAASLSRIANVGVTSPRPSPVTI